MADVRTDTLLIPTAVLEGSPGTVAALNDALRAVDPELSIQEPTTKGPTDGITRLRLSTGDAVRAVQILRAAKDLPAAAHVSPDAVYRSRPILPEDQQVLFAAGSKIGHGAESLVAVHVEASAPPWDEEFTGRRPVVALLDSGVDSTHEWLKMGSFCLDAVDRGATVLPESAGHYVGHGTFVAGLVRQAAPQAQVLSYRVMNGAGEVDADHFEDALRWLLGELASGSDERRFDVLCIPFGYVPAVAVTEDAHAGRVRRMLIDIAGHGVRIIASAGNQGLDVKTYPAAFTADDEVPMVSVGATNPDGSRAYYSNHGDWVTHTEVGSGVISTMPGHLDGPEPVGGPVPPPGSRFLDPDNFVGGFGRWSGTSFAAAIAAGKHAADLTS